uniref:TIR domain-containing protein n=2 Tax=Tetraodon nigroviridis TaxID=99883 RepID=H3CKF9_TETNG
MSRSALHLFFLCWNLQVSSCDPSCTLYLLVADCAFKDHLWVPVLPPNITHLFLNTNLIGEVNSTSLSAYEQLEKLDLGHQKVALVIRSNAFLRQRKLSVLVLGFNPGLRLEPRTFAGLFRLQQLSLDYCELNHTVLAGSYLEPLLSLRKLDLFGNQISALRPGRFFSKLQHFTELNLKLNPIERLCESDLAGFQGKHFGYLSLSSTRIGRMRSATFDWERCGNPFRHISFGTLDMSGHGFDLKTLSRFFKAIQGTLIEHLILHGHMGRDFSYANLPDPEEETFQGLGSSGIQTLDLSGNRIFALNRAVFQPLGNMRILDLSRNKINQIETRAFDGLQADLRLLNLSSNLLGEIYAHTFSSLAELRVLDLSQNHIGALGHQAFSGLPKLRGLFLTGNSLRNLGFPASLPNLELLLLGDNKLDSLYGVADLAGNSTYLDVRDNRLSNLNNVHLLLSRFHHLKELMFGGNFIKWCQLNGEPPIPPNSSLKVLDLHDSSLQTIWSRGQCLDLFHHLNHLQGLNLSFNFLEKLPLGVFSGLSSIQEIDLSFNALTYLPSDGFPASLSILHIAGNFLASPEPGILRSLDYLDLEGNRFHCDCHLEAFLAWLNVTRVTHLSPVAKYACAFPAALQNLPLLSYSRSMEPCEVDDEESTRGLRFALFVLTSSLVTAAVLCGAAYARLRGHIFIVYKKILRRVVDDPKRAATADEGQYDVFLCFSSGDYRWVEAAVLKKLDSQLSEGNAFRCCFEARDFLPGEDHLSNIRDAIWGSRKTLCIVSNRFLKDGWCLEAFTLAQGRMLEELTNTLVMLVVGKVAHYQLMRCNAVRAFVQKREYLTWPEDPQDLDWFYQKLISLLLKHTKVKKCAEENPEPVAQTADRIQLQDI